MRGKDFNTGLRGTLFEAQHYVRMGPAVWLYGWLVLRQTRQEGSVGWVLGGKPISYREIEEETGFERKTLERWVKTLRGEGYIETTAAPAGIVIRITKAKKFQRHTLVADPGKSAPERPCRNPLLKFKEGHRENEERPPHFCGAKGSQTQESTPVSGRIGSGSVVREEKDKSSGLSPEKTLLRAGRMEHVAEGAAAAAARAIHWRDLREEREEMVRRELRVGAGPELRRHREEES